LDENILAYLLHLEESIRSYCNLFTLSELVVYLITLG